MNTMLGKVKINAAEKERAGGPSAETGKFRRNSLHRCPPT